MSAFWAWLFGTRVGRFLTIAAAVSAAFFMALARSWRAGRTFEQSKRDQASLEAWRQRREQDDEVSKLDERRARDELSRWVRPGKGTR